MVEEGDIIDLVADVPGGGNRTNAELKEAVSITSLRASWEQYSQAC